MRPAPRIRPATITARAVLHPSGAHELEVDASHNIVAMRFSRDQVAALKGYIARFEEVVTVEDGRSGPDRTATKLVALEGWR